MDPGMVYPTAPFDTHAQTPNVDVPHTGAGEKVESPGKTMAVLSKVKNKAKKLKNKLKKVRGSSKTSTDHGQHDTRDSPIFDEGAESDEDDEEEEKPNQNEFKYEQLRSIGALDSPGDGSEVEVHGGVPVPAAADNRGTYWKKSDDSDPIGPYKSAGPPDALQATPTKYRNYAADDDVLPEKGVSADRKLEVGSPPVEYGRTGKEDVSSSVPEVKASNRSYDERVEPHSKLDISGVPATYTDEAFSENLVERSPSFGKSSTPIYDNIAVADEDLSADRKLGVGLFPGKHAGSGTENAPYTSVPEFNADEKVSFLSDAEQAEPTSKPDVSDVPASYTDEPFSESLAERNPAFGKLSTPIYDNIAVADEDLSADRKLGVGLSPDEHVGSGKGTPLHTSVPEYKPEEKSALLSDAQQAEPSSSHGSVDSASVSASASDMDVSYPGDIVKPNPSFGKSSSPTHEKIAVMNEDASPDGMRGFGLSTEDHSGSGKGNLLDTSVPEFEELSGYRKGSSSGPLEADELVYKPLSEPEPEVGSSLASTPGQLEKVAGQSFGTDQEPDNKTRQTRKISERDLDLPTSVVDKSDSKGEDDLSTSYSEQRAKFDEATKQPADSAADTSGGDDRANWGKWSADKINKAKDVTVSGLVGTDYRPDSETRGYDPVDAVGSGVEVPDSQNIDAAKQDAIEGESKDVEEEYYDPNEVKDNQFEEGFALGSEDALSGTLAGSAIDKLQGLKETVQSSLGYSTPDNTGVGGEDKSGLEREEGALSPSSYKQQTGGLVQGLREGVASSLGYGKAVSDGTEHSKDGFEGGLGSEADRDSRQLQPGLEGEESAPSPRSYKQPTGGFIQGLKQTVASSLGYGRAASEEAGDKIDTLERGGDLEGDFDSSQHQPGVEGVERTPSTSSNEQKTGDNVQGLAEVVASSPGSGEAASDEVGHNKDAVERSGGSEGNVNIMQHQPVLEGEEKALSPSSYKQQTGGFVQGLKQAVASSLGYDKIASDEGGHENDVLEKGDGSEADFDSSQHQPGSEGKDRVLSSSSYEQQIGGDVQEPKEVVASPFGLKEAVESPLGYGEEASDEAGHNNDVLERDGVTVGGDDTRQYSPVLEGEEAALSPSSYKQQQTGGFVQGLKNTVASSLGYGKGTSEESGHEKDASGRGGGSEADLDSKQQQPGTYQALKNVVASKLGYGSAENSPVITKESESRELPVEQVSHEPKLGYGSAEQSPVITKESEAPEFPVEQVPHEPLYNQGGEQQHDTEGRYAQSETRDDVNRENEVSELPGVLEDVKDRVIATPGYNSQPEDTPTDATHMESVPSPSSYSQKLMDTTAAARNYLSSKIGYGGSSKEKEVKDFDHEYEGEKSLSPPTHVDNTVNEQSSVASKLHPSDEDKALSDLITEKMSSTANMIGGKVASGFEEEEKTLSPSSFKQQTGVVSSLEYGKAVADETEHNKDGLDGSGGLEADLPSRKEQPAFEGEERAISHSSYKQETGGFVEGLKNMVASSLGYGIAASEEADHEIDGVERGGGSEADLDSKQQQPEAYQALQNVVTPELGYESAEKLPAIAKENEPCEPPVEEVSQEKLYSEGGYQQHVTEGGDVLSDARDNAGDGGSDVDLESKLQQPGTYQALKNVVASKLGFGPAEQSPVTTKEEEARKLPVEESQEQLYNEGGQQQHGTEGVYVPSDVRDNATEENEVSASPGGEGSDPEGEERALSPSSHKQTDGFVQALSEPVASAPGYGNTASIETEHGEDVLDGGGESEADLDARKQQSSLEGEESVLSPSIYKPQTGGFVQGLKQTVASSLGYGKRASDEGGYKNDGLQQGGESETDIVSSPHQQGSEVEDRVLSPSNYEQQTGGVIEGLKDSHAPSLGYGKAASDEAGYDDVSEKADELEGDVDSRQPPPVLEGEEGALSPSSNKQQQTGGLVQGLKSMIASSLGYGKATSEEAGHEKDAQERDDGANPDLDSEQQQPGTYQALKNVGASKLGYGPAEKSPVITKEKESREFPVEEMSQERLYNEGGEQQHDSEGEHMHIDARDDTNRENEVSNLPGSGEVLQDVKGHVVSTPGSNSQPEDTSTDATHVESVSSPSSYTQKLMSTTAAARNYLSSKVGYGSSSKEKGEKDLVHGHEGEKVLSPSTHVGSTENEQSSIVSKLHPSDDDKAPSDLLSESVSSTASRKGMEDGSVLEGEEEALSPSNDYKQQTDGFVQGLREPVASSPGYVKAASDETEHDGDGLDGDGGLEVDLAASKQPPGLEGEESALSPSSYKPQTGGFVQGLKQTVASSLGYGKRASNEAGYKNDGLQQGGESEADFDSSPYQPGSEGEDGVLSPSSYEQQMVDSGLGLKEAVVSPLGYDEAASDAAAGHNIDVLGRGGGSEADIATGQYQAVLEGEEKAFSPSSYKQRTGGFVQGLKQMVTSSLGYGNVASDEAGHKNDGLERGGESEADFDSSQYQSAPEGEDMILSPSSYEQQTGGDVQGPKEADVSPLGLKETVASTLGHSKAAETGGDVQGLEEVDGSPLGLKETVVSPLGYSKAASDEAAHNNNDVLKKGGGAEADVDSMQYQPALSPSSYKPQTGGFVQGLKNPVASSLGYGEAAPEDSGHENEGFGRDGGSEADLDSKQQQPGTYQALKNAVASKLGYGSTEKSPVITNENEPQEFPVEVPQEQLYNKGGEQQHGTEGGYVESVARDVPQEQLYKEGGEQQHETEEGYVLSEAKDNAQDEGSEAVLDSKQQKSGTFQALKSVVTSKLGYGPADQSPVITEENESCEFPVKEESQGQLYNAGGEQQRDTEGGYVQSDVRDKANRENEVSTVHNSQPEDTPSHIESVPSPSSYTQKVMHTTAAAKSFLSSKIGYGGSNKERGEKGFDHGQEGEKSLSPSAPVENTEYEQSSIASKLHPSNEDKALADLITERVASTASMMGKKLRLFGSPRSSDMPASYQPQH